MPAVKQVYRGAVNYTAASGTDPTDIVVGPASGINIDNCYVEYSTRNGDFAGRNQRHLFTATLLSSGGNILLSFSRNEASDATSLDIEWTVTEFESSALNQIVQRGEIDKTLVTSNITIAATNQAATGIFTSFKTSLGDALNSFTRVSPYTCALAGGSASARTTLAITSGAAPASGQCVIAWQLVEFKTADVSAQHGTTSFTSSGTATIATVGDLTKSCVTVTGFRGGNPAGNRAFPRVKLNSASQLGFNAQVFGTAEQNDVSWSVFEFLDGVRVEKGEAVIADGSLTPTQPTFAAMNLNRAQPFIGWPATNGYNPSTTSDGNVGTAAVTQRVNATGDGLTLTRNISTSSFEVGWTVVEWPVASAGGVTLIIAASSQTNTSASVGVAQNNSLAVAASSQTNTSAVVTIAQLGILAVGQSNQVNTSSAPEISQVHFLNIGSSSGSNISASIGITQNQSLTVAPSVQLNASSAPTIAQNNALVPSGSTQSNVSGAPSILLGVVNNLAVAASTQVNVTGASAVAQVHSLIPASSNQINTSAPVSVAQNIVLIVATAIQSNVSSSPQITQVHVLAVAAATQINEGHAIVIGSETLFVIASSVQSNVASPVAITQIQILAAAPSIQRNTSASSVISLPFLIFTNPRYIAYYYARDYVAKYQE